MGQIVIQRDCTACSWRNSNNAAKTHQALIDEPKRKLAKSEWSFELIKIPSMIPILSAKKPQIVPANWDDPEYQVQESGS